MKKLVLLLTLLLSISTYVSAQNYTEVVYLKNGSVIKGVIIEQVPNVSLKIKTSDGSLIICPMNEVTKITKEGAYTKDNSKDGGNFKPTINTFRGYKGFVDFGYIFGFEDYNASNKLEISTSHGYQFNNYFYIGGGIAADYYTDASLFSVPIFVHFRANFLNKKIAPFAEVKTGYSVGDIGGGYFAVGLGVRFALKGKKALNLKLEYNYQQYDYTYSGYYNTYDATTNLNGLGLKLGFEF